MDAALSFPENKFSPQCAELWMSLFYQVVWQCDFLLMKFPFEKVPCVLELELQDGQRWHPQRLNVTVPVFRHLPYLVSSAITDENDDNNDRDTPPLITKSVILKTA